MGGGQSLSAPGARRELSTWGVLDGGMVALS